MQGFTFKQVDSNDTRFVRRFLEVMGDSDNRFRYFATRPLSVIANHLFTLVVLDSGGDPVGYGHLDPEDDNVWLGVCVAEEHRGKGLGKAVVRRLLSEASRRYVKVVSLSVDEDNLKAISLYLKFGFVLVGKRDTTFLFRWENSGSASS